MIWFENAIGLWRVALTAVLVYVFLIVLVRLLGTRSTAKMNSFDWVVTIAMGSLMSSIILAKDVVLVEGLLSILVLMLLQYAASFATSRWRPMKRLLLNPPCLLYYNGIFVESAMHSERVSREEVESAVRREGFRNLDEVLAVVLEVNAEIGVIGREERPPDTSLLEDISGYDAAQQQLAEEGRMES